MAWQRYRSEPDPAGNNTEIGYQPIKMADKIHQKIAIFVYQHVALRLSTGISAKLRVANKIGKAFRFAYRLQSGPGERIGATQYRQPVGKIARTYTVTSVGHQLEITVQRPYPVERVAHDGESEITLLGLVPGKVAQASRRAMLGNSVLAAVVDIAQPPKPAATKRQVTGREMWHQCACDRLSGGLVDVHEDEAPARRDNHLICGLPLPGRVSHAGP